MPVQSRSHQRFRLHRGLRPRSFISRRRLLRSGGGRRRSNRTWHCNRDLRSNPNHWHSNRIAQQPQPPAQQSNALGALFSLDLGRFIIPPSAGQSFPTPPKIPGPSPTPTDFEFEDAIINTYHAIEPWVRYGFEVATYAVGWIPWVGWLAPQIMIFYNFGERIVESLVVNSANWLWGPLPFGEGLGNVAEDSWNALLQLGRDQWNFWLPPLPPLPFDAQEAQTQLAAAETLAPADQSVASPTVKPHPLRDALAALHRFLAGPDAVVPEDVDPQEGVDPQERGRSARKGRPAGQG